MFLFGKVSIGAVQVNSGEFNASGLSAGISDAGAGNVSDFGNFNQTFNGPNPVSSAVSSFSFTINNTAGAWASSADVLTMNSSGFHAAAHVIVMDQTGAAVVTGFVGDGSGSLPDGGTTLALLGFALVGIESLRRNLKKA